MRGGEMGRGKRFFDSENWETKKFRLLKPNSKLLLIYIESQCDIAGFLEIDNERLQFDIGLTDHEVKESYGEIKELLVRGKGTWIFRKYHLVNQSNLPLKTNNKAHLGIYRRFERNMIHFQDNQEFEDEIKPYKDQLDAFKDL